jgi:hypothetical protein
MGIIKRSLLASCVAITLVAPFTHDIDAAQWTVRRPPETTVRKVPQNKPLVEHKPLVELNDYPLKRKTDVDDPLRHFTFEGPRQDRALGFINPHWVEMEQRNAERTDRANRNEYSDGILR